MSELLDDKVEIETDPAVGSGVGVAVVSNNGVVSGVGVGETEMSLMTIRYTKSPYSVVGVQ